MPLEHADHIKIIKQLRIHISLNFKPLPASTITRVENGAGVVEGNGNDGEGCLQRCLQQHKKLFQHFSPRELNFNATGLRGC